MLVSGTTSAPPWSLQGSLGAEGGADPGQALCEIHPIGSFKVLGRSAHVCLPTYRRKLGVQKAAQPGSSLHPGVPTALLLPVAGCLVVALGPAQTLDASVPWSPVLPHLGSSVASKMWETGVLVLKN